MYEEIECTRSKFHIYVWLDEWMSFKEHIQHVAAKISCIIMPFIRL